MVVTYVAGYSKRCRIAVCTVLVPVGEFVMRKGYRYGIIVR